MIKSHLLCIIILISAFLITLELIALQMIVKQNKFEPNPIWYSLYQVASAASIHSLPLFLIDAKLLGSLKEPSKSDPSLNYCLVFCKGQKVTNLMMLGEYAPFTRLFKFIKSLRDLGFTIFEFNALDPTLLHHDLKVTIPLHLIIFSEDSSRDKGHIIHITIVHERLNKYWWSAKLELTEYEKRLIHRQGSRQADFVFGNYDVIFEKFETENARIDGLNIGLPSDLNKFYNLKPAKYNECNKTRAKEWYERYGHGNTNEEELFRIEARRLLLKVKAILDELEIPFWLSSGTCLGYFRQCDFITYSGDVDIGIWIEDYKPVMIDYFLMNHLPLLHVFGKIEDSFELSFRDDHLKLDIFFFYHEKDYVWNGGTQAKSGLKYKYIFPKFQLCWSDFLDDLFQVPCDTLLYIEANYGKNWSIPIKKWDWKLSPSNVKPNGRWPVEEWHQVIQTFSLPEVS